VSYGLFSTYLSGAGASSTNPTFSWTGADTDAACAMVVFKAAAAAAGKFCVAPEMMGALGSH